MKPIHRDIGAALAIIIIGLAFGAAVNNAPGYVDRIIAEHSR